MFVTGLTLGMCIFWVLIEPGWASATTLLFSLVAFLTVVSDPEISEKLGQLRRSALNRAGRRLSSTIKTRHQRQPNEIVSFFLPGESKLKHEIGVYLLKDSHDSGLIKALVHRAPLADPYDIMTVEGAQPRFQVLDLDHDGRPELFVETCVGAHTHQVNVFRLNRLNRFHEVQGSPLFADWGPVTLEQADHSSIYQITILKGSGAAGSNAKPLTYLLSERGLEPLAREPV